MLNFLRSKKQPTDLLSSTLFDEKTFYQAFLKDVARCKEEVVIESPFITSKRAMMLVPIFKKLLSRGVRIYIVTRDPQEHDVTMQGQADEVVRVFASIGAQVFLCVGNHHRKVAILDRTIIWEGSLNILSQTYSREFMRRIYGKDLAVEMFHFLNLSKII